LITHPSHFDDNGISADELAPRDEMPNNCFKQTFQSTFSIFGEPSSWSSGDFSGDNDDPGGLSCQLPVVNCPL
jgi:hypothetical protein